MHFWVIHPFMNFEVHPHHLKEKQEEIVDMKEESTSVEGSLFKKTMSDR
jgi:hypothetical protein